MRRIPLGLALFLILAGPLGCQTIRPVLPQALPWIHPTPTPVSYAEQMRHVVKGMGGWIGGVVQCFAPLRALGLDRETARDCHPRELQRDGQRILRRLRATSPPTEVKSAHDRLIVGVDELLEVIEEREGQSATMTRQQFQAIDALDGIIEALREIGDVIGPSEPE